MEPPGDRVAAAADTNLVVVTARVKVRAATAVRKAKTAAASGRGVNGIDLSTSLDFANIETAGDIP